MIQGWNYNYFTDKFKYIPEKIHAVCIGTTQAHFAFDFSMYDVQGFNMAVWLNYFTYSKLLLEKYKNKIKTNNNVDWLFVLSSTDNYAPCISRSRPKAGTIYLLTL